MVLKICVKGFDSGNGDQYFNATFQVSVSVVLWMFFLWKTWISSEIYSLAYSHSCVTPENNHGLNISSAGPMAQSYDSLADDFCSPVFCSIILWSNFNRTSRI